MPNWLPYVLYLIVLPLARLTFVAVAPLPSVIAAFEDDAYYYFVVAQNVAEGLGSTYDGLSLTNGYHPMWLALLVPVFAALDGGRSGLVGVAALSSLIWASTVLLVRQMGLSLRRPALVSVAFAPFAFLATVRPNLAFGGMESVLALFGLVLTVNLAVTRGLLEKGRSDDAFAVGLAMALTAVARLDAVLVLLPLGLLILDRARRRGEQWVRLGLATFAPTAVLLTAYILVNQRLFGLMTPVSSRVKGIGAPPGELGIVIAFLREPVLAGQSMYFGAITFLIVVASGARFAMLSRRVDAAPDAVWPNLTAAFAVGMLLLLSWHALATAWWTPRWYFYALPVLSLCAIVSVGLLHGWPESRALRFLAVSAAAAISALSVADLAWAANRQQPLRFPEESVAIAGELNAVLPAGAILAMGDRAGSLGYLLDRPLFQLEGLMNSAEFLTALKNGTADQLMITHGVTHYARSSQDPGVPAFQWESCRTFQEPTHGRSDRFPVTVCAEQLVVDHLLEPEEGYYRVWRFDPNRQR